MERNSSPADNEGSGDAPQRASSGGVASGQVFHGELRQKSKSGPTRADAAGPHSEGPYLDYGPEPPASYGMNRLVALPLDPLRVFLYWEFRGPAEIPGLGPFGGGARWTLRVFNVTRSSFSDVEIGITDGNHYLHVEQASLYRFEIGIKEGKLFQPFLECGPIHTLWSHRRRRREVPVWAHRELDVTEKGVVSYRPAEIPKGIAGTRLSGLSYRESVKALESLTRSYYSADFGK